MSMRIQRAIARAGVASRRRAEALILAGRVTVNGSPAHIGQVVDPDADIIHVDNAVVGAPARERWLVLNKPTGVMTTRRDPSGRQTVFDYTPDVPGLTYVGRLDLLTEGVLLFTTDGQAAHRLTHPSGGVERKYVATVRGDAPAAVRAARRGVALDDGIVVPAEITAASMAPGQWALTVTIAEGRNREVRRLCKALDLFVDRLVRTQFGPVSLGRLAPGETRALTSHERTIIRSLVADVP
ncbi:MAG: pseudouridine synthase [Gemmatimonadaceae bacterium]